MVGYFTISEECHLGEGFTIVTIDLVMEFLAVVSV